MIAAMLLTWALVTLDCAGGHEAIDHYEVRYNVARLLGWQMCPTEDDPEAVCPIYSSFAWSAPVAVVEPPFDTKELDIGVGEVLTWEVTAVDEAGNRDCGVTE